MRRTRIATAMLLLLLVGSSGLAESTLTLDVGRGPGVEVPLELRSDVPADTGDALVAGSDDGVGEVLLQNGPALFDPSDGPDVGRAFCMILPADSRASRLRAKPASDAKPRFSFVERSDGTLNLLEGEMAVFSYVFGMQLADGVPAQYRRSTYIHPLIDLQGNPITDDFPKDHFHHRGLSWTWPVVRVGDEVHDLWAVQGIRQVFERWLVCEVGPVCATLGVKNTWETGGRKVMDEWVWIRAFAAGRQGRAIDVRLTLQAREPIQMAGREVKGYGGFCLRYAPREDTIITTPDGRLKADSDLSRYAWADESARFGGSTDFVGAAIFQHASNPGFPAGWCLRHYGLIGVSWPGTETITFEPGKPLTLRFRVWVHAGDAAKGNVRGAYDAFAKPPAVSLSQ